MATQFGLPLAEFNSYLWGLVVVAEDGAGNGGATAPNPYVLRGGGYG
jgi:hypothetical protein